MDQLREFLEAVRQHAGGRHPLRGLLHILIGRRITTTDGTAVSGGLTWRETAQLLKRVRWEPETVKELGLEASELPMRDRERFWYHVIARAGVESPEAIAAAEKLAHTLQKHGYVVGPAPGRAK
jgi:hypothetical protein